MIVMNDVALVTASSAPAGNLVIIKSLGPKLAVRGIDPHQPASPLMVYFSSTAAPAMTFRHSARQSRLRKWRAASACGAC